jgi:hypothetical protein
MSFRSTALRIVSLVVIVGCNSCERQEDDGRRSFKALAEAYQEAHDKKDVNALMELVHIGSGPSAQMNRMEFRKNLTFDVEHKIKRISRKRLERDDQIFRKYATLKPLGMMEIEWVTNDENVKQFCSSYCFGKLDGVYYLVGIGPGMVEEGLKALSNGEGPDGKMPGVKERARLALSRWQDQAINPEPILFWADLSRPVTALAINFFDEDMDVIGFGIEEHHIDPNGTKQVLTEEYPAFVHFQWPDVGILKIVPIHVRDAGQQADTKKWDDYAKGVGIDMNLEMSREYWKETLPPVWVSIPEPNVTDVCVYVYDRAGHKSEPVELMAPDRHD